MIMSAVYSPIVELFCVECHQPIIGFDEVYQWVPYAKTQRGLEMLQSGARPYPSDTGHILEWVDVTNLPCGHGGRVLVGRAAD
jgi:hypothetical protein